MPNIYHPRLRPTAPLSHSDNQKVPHVFPNPCWALDWRLKVPLCPMCHSPQEIQNSTTSHFLQHCCPSPSSVPFFFFLPHHTACRLLVPSPGTKLKPPAVEAQSLNRWTTKEVSVVYKILYIRSHHSSVHTFQSFVSHTD